MESAIGFVTALIYHSITYIVLQIGILVFFYFFLWKMVINNMLDYITARILILSLNSIELWYDIMSII